MRMGTKMFPPISLQRKEMDSFEGPIDARQPVSPQSTDSGLDVPHERTLFFKTRVRARHEKKEIQRWKEPVDLLMSG